MAVFSKRVNFIMSTCFSAVAIGGILVCPFTALAATPNPAAIPENGPANSPVSVTDLGTLGGASSAGFGVNNQGQVVGTSRITGDKSVHAFFYSDGKMTDLGTLGGDQSEAYALNDSGQVTGEADIKAKSWNHDFLSHAFLWQQGHMSELGTSRADDSAGLAINRAGKVVGRIIRGGFSGFGSGRACTWSGGKVDTLNNSDAVSSQGTGINNNGQVAETHQKPGRPFQDSQAYGTYYCDHAAIWQRGKLSELDIAGTEISLANAINDSGQVAGAASFSPGKVLHACLWQNGKMIDLGTLAGQDTVVYGINHDGIMVGGTNPNDLYENGKTLGGADKGQDAFCCSGIGRRIVDLNSLIDAASGWALLDARSISDTGYVTGLGIHDDQLHAYLLKLPQGGLNLALQMSPNELHAHSAMASARKEWPGTVALDIATGQARMQAAHQLGVNK